MRWREQETKDWRSFQVHGNPGLGINIGPHAYQLLLKIAKEGTGWEAEEAAAFLDLYDERARHLRNAPGSGRSHGDPLRGEAAGAVVVGVIRPA